MVALSMADGYARLTGLLQCVIVHVDVGTQGLGAAIHNASCGRAPILVFAGMSPVTCEGELRGSRTEYIHWIQDVHSQREIVGGYCRWSGEVKRGCNVKQMVGRAYQNAVSEPRGPVYLMGGREAMEEEIPEGYRLVPEHWGPAGLGALPEDGVRVIAEALVDAGEPLLITGYSGRNHEAPGELVRLAETVKGIRMLDTGGSDMCFPADHRASVGLRYGVDDCIKTADVILVADCDVPWIPTQCKPKPDAKIFHVDSDPLKQQMPVFYLPTTGRWKANSCTVFRQLHTYISSTPALSERASSHTERWDRIGQIHSERMARIKELALLPAGADNDSSFNASFLTAAVREQVPDHTIFAVEAVTSTASVADQILPTIPGTWINCGGGGLGWSGGGSLGIKLAAGKARFVCCIVGDGTFLFSVPGSVYWISQRYGLPVLTIVLNNAGESRSHQFSFFSFYLPLFDQKAGTPPAAPSSSSTRTATAPAPPPWTSTPPSLPPRRGTPTSPMRPRAGTYGPAPPVRSVSCAGCCPSLWRV